MQIKYTEFPSTFFFPGYIAHYVNRAEFQVSVPSRTSRPDAVCLSLIDSFALHTVFCSLTLRSVCA